ncbi:MAG TPA: RDD family protein, partial [Microlunatus sp.]
LVYVRIIELATTANPDPSLLGDLLRPALVWTIIGLVLMLAAIGWLWYNRWLTAGRTGQSMGKRVLRTKLVAEVNGRPIGGVNAFLRDLLHVLDGAFFIGYLWPLWDAKRQTFSDTIMKTVVIDHPAPGGPPPGGPAPAAPAPTGADPYGPTS